MSEDTEECPETHEGEQETTLPPGAQPCLLLLEDGFPIKNENTLFVELQQCLP